MRFLGCMLVLVLFLVGCNYQVGLDHSKAKELNPNLLGRWIAQFDDEEDHIEIFVYMEGEEEDNDYAVAYVVGGAALLFRGYLVEVEGKDILNLQWLNKDEDTTREYFIATYTIIDNVLRISSLRAEIVSPKIKSAEELEKQIRAHINDVKLFDQENTGVYRRVQ